MTLTQNITLDVARETALHISGKQYDENSRFLLVTIREAGEEKSIPAGSTITLNARRPDGSAQSFAGSIQDGKALVEIDQWVLEQYGTVYCSVSVVDSSASKLTTLSFRLLVERAEGSGFVLVYVAASALPAGTYYIPMAGVNYSFTTTQAVPAGGKIYFSSNGTTGKTTNNGATIEELTLTAGSTGTELQGSDIVNFLTQMQANVAAIDAELDSKADKSAIEENLTAGTSLATIDKNSYTPSTSPYLYRISPSGKRCEMDIIGGTVGWNQNIAINAIRETRTVQGVQFTNNGDGSVTLNGTATGTTNDAGLWMSTAYDTTHVYFCRSLTDSLTKGTSGVADHGRFDITSGRTYNATFYPCRIDLTTLLGSPIADYAYTLEQATAGSGIAWLRSFGFLSKSYYPYTEPTLESVQATARVARGINQWDEEWEAGSLDNTTGIPTSDSSNIRAKNYCLCIPDSTYYFYSGSGKTLRYYWYDADYAFISGNTVMNASAIAPSNAHYFKVRTTQSYGNTYNHDICINISNPTINGTYYPYESHTYPLGNTTLRGIPKLDSNNNIYYDGDKYKASGEITRKYGVVEASSLNWELIASGTYPYFRVNDPTMFWGVSQGILLAGYDDLGSMGGTDFGNLSDAKGYSRGVGNNVRYFKVRNTTCATVEAFKTALNGVYLVYELATPTTETTDSFTPIQYTGSTEAFTTSNDVPVGVDAKYYDDLTLPKLPTTNGTYTLKCTVTDGTGIVSWVSE